MKKNKKSLRNITFRAVSLEYIGTQISYIVLKKSQILIYLSLSYSWDMDISNSSQALIPKSLKQNMPTHLELDQQEYSNKMQD